VIVDWRRYHVEPLPTDGIALACTDCLGDPIEKWPTSFPPLMALMNVAEEHEKVMHE
jgi:hypothetical protein